MRVGTFLSLPRRMVATLLAALVAHGVVAAALAPPAVADPAVAAAARKRQARTDRARLLATAAHDVDARRVTLGETFVVLGSIDHVEDEGAALDPGEVQRAIATYRALLAEVLRRRAAGEPLDAAIASTVADEGHAARYKRMYPRLFDALAHGGGNCVALSTLAVALAYDAGQHDDVNMRVYTNHVTPDVNGFRFGMAARCHGEGAKVAVKELLDRYGRARATHDPEVFSFPPTDDACDDPGDVFGAVQLRRDDPPPMPARPRDARSDADAPARPTMAPETPPRSPLLEVECRRRSVLEEYDEDVEAIGADGRTLGGVGLTRLAALDLEGHAKSAACFEGRAQALAEGSDDAAIAAHVLALGDAALSLEEAARVFAFAGELDVAREYERRLGARRAQAAAPLERVNGWLVSAAPTPARSDIVAGAGRLVALGEGGRTAMMLALDQHRGFWEIATLMTRPSSRVGALRRWSEKPPAVQLDVVDALPCGSEAFLAQIAEPPSTEGQRLRAACVARARAERQPCDLDAALASLREGQTTRESSTLAQAVVVRSLSARCREPAFVTRTRAWSAAVARESPADAPIASAATTRLAF